MAGVFLEACNNLQGCNQEPASHPVRVESLVSFHTVSVESLISSPRSLGSPRLSADTPRLRIAIAIRSREHAPCRLIPLGGREHTRGAARPASSRIVALPAHLPSPGAPSGAAQTSSSRATVHSKCTAEAHSKLPVSTLRWPENQTGRFSSSTSPPVLVNSLTAAGRRGSAASSSGIDPTPDISIRAGITAVAREARCASRLSPAQMWSRLRTISKGAFS